MEIQVGEYVRDKAGVINKVTEIQDYEEENDIWYKGEKIVGGTWRSMATKHSFNIIDLIEEGDYVNGMEILHIEGDTLYVEWSNEFDDYTAWVDNEAIKSIVTKEMMKSVEYRID